VATRYDKVRHEVAVLPRVNSQMGGSADAGCVVPGMCSMPVPTLRCVAGNGGVRSSEIEAEAAAVPPGVVGEGNGRAGDARNPR
jgi:hypothetical protein